MWQKLLTHRGLISRCQWCHSELDFHNGHFGLDPESTPHSHSELDSESLVPESSLSRRKSGTLRA